MWRSWGQWFGQQSEPRRRSERRTWTARFNAVDLELRSARRRWGERAAAAARHGPGGRPRRRRGERSACGSGSGESRNGRGSEARPVRAPEPCSPSSPLRSGERAGLTGGGEASGSATAGRSHLLHFRIVGRGEAGELGRARRDVAPMGDVEVEHGDAGGGKFRRSRSKSNSAPSPTRWSAASASWGCGRPASRRRMRRAVRARSPRPRGATLHRGAARSAPRPGAARPRARSRRSRARPAPEWTTSSGIRPEAARRRRCAPRRGGRGRSAGARGRRGRS